VTVTPEPHPPTAVRPTREGWVAAQFALSGLVWGASFLFIAVALTGMTPVQVAAGRALLGALTLGLIVLVTRDRLPAWGPIWGHLAVVGVTFCVLPYLLFAWAQQYVASGLASVYNATTPIMTAVLAALVFHVERLTRAQVVGIVIGILGVLVIIGPWRGIELGGDLLPQLAMLGATACYGFSLSYMRRFLTNTGVSAVVFTFIYIALAALVLLLLTPLTSPAPLRLDPAVIGAIVLLGALGTGFAYVWNQNVVRAWGATRASTVTYITPVVGVLLGIIVLGEVLVWNEPVGAVLVIVGVLLAQRRLGWGRRR
jgi:drug/metabolite transporter (DMT)-like permease